MTDTEKIKILFVPEIYKAVILKYDLNTSILTNSNNAIGNLDRERIMLLNAAFFKHLNITEVNNFSFLENSLELFSTNTTDLPYDTTIKFVFDMYEGINQKDEVFDGNSIDYLYDSGVFIVFLKSSFKNILSIPATGGYIKQFVINILEAIPKKIGCGLNDVIKLSLFKTIL